MLLSKPYIGRHGGQEYDHNHMRLTQTSQKDYEELCCLDILRLADSHEHDQKAVYDEFKEHLVRSEEGWYEKGLPWHGGHPDLPKQTRKHSPPELP